MSVVYVPPTAASAISGALTVASPYANHVGGFYGHPHAAAYPFGQAGMMYGGQYPSMYNPMSMGYGMGMGMGGGMGGLYDRMHYGYDDDFLYRGHGRRYRRRGLYGSRRRSLGDWLDDDYDYF